MYISVNAIKWNEKYSNDVCELCYNICIEYMYIFDLIFFSCIIILLNMQIFFWGGGGGELFTLKDDFFFFLFLCFFFVCLLLVVGLGGWGGGAGGAMIYMIKQCFVLFEKISFMTVTVTETENTCI